LAATSALSNQETGDINRLLQLGIRAAIYFRQASIQMPSNLKTHLALGFAYFNLKKFDLADVALAEARRIDPASPLVKELEADLQERQPS
jgi:hypothetical protein